MTIAANFLKKLFATDIPYWVDLLVIYHRFWILLVWCCLVAGQITLHVLMWYRWKRYKERYGNELGEKISDFVKRRNLRTSTQTFNHHIEQTPMEETVGLGSSNSQITTTTSRESPDSKKEGLSLSPIRILLYELFWKAFGGVWGRERTSAEVDDLLLADDIADLMPQTTNQDVQKPGSIDVNNYDNANSVIPLESEQDSSSKLIEEEKAEKVDQLFLRSEDFGKESATTVVSANLPQDALQMPAENRGGMARETLGETDIPWSKLYPTTKKLPDDSNSRQVPWPTRNELLAFVLV